MNDNDEGSTTNDAAADAPAWLEELVECVVDTCKCETGLGWRWTQEGDDQSETKGDLFEVVIYPRVIEVQGKPCTPSDIFYDVQEILDLFDACGAISLLFGSSNDIDHLSIEGTVGGHDVWLNVLMAPPEDEEATLRMRDDGTVEDISEEAKGRYSDPEQQSVVEADHDDAVDDVVAEVVRTWKADRAVPGDLLDRLAQLFVEVS